MMFMRRIINYSILKHRIYEDILKELTVESTVQYMHQYMRRLQKKEHIERMEPGRWPKPILQILQKVDKIRKTQRRLA